MTKKVKSKELKEAMELAVNSVLDETLAEINELVILTFKQEIEKRNGFATTIKQESKSNGVTEGGDTNNR